jgi:hypothetical protein
MKKAILSTLLFSASFGLFLSSCKKDKSNKDFGKGLKINSVAALEKVDEADIDEDMMATPASFALDMPPIVSQGNSNKCVSFSSGYYIMGLYNGLKSTSASGDAAGSVEFLHSTYKKINSDAGCNEGAFLFDEDNILGVGTILETKGFCTWGQLPFVDVQTCTNIPANLETDALNNKIGGYKRLDKNEFNNTSELKSWLYSGFPLWFAANVDDAFQNLGADDIWNSPSGNGSPHAMVISGWDDSKKAFKICNSWGTDFADNGFAWVDYEYLKVLLAETSEIGVLYPNDNQRTVFNKLSPASCGNGNWGDIFIDNKLTELVSIEMTGANNYINDNAEGIDASEGQSFAGIPAGDVVVKIFNADKTTLLKEYTVNVQTCGETVVTVE